MKKISLIFSFLELPSDIFAIFLSFIIAYWYRTQAEYSYIWQYSDYIRFAYTVLPIWILFFGLQGLYSNKRNKGEIAEFINIFIAVSSSIAVIIAYIFFSKTDFFSRLIIMYVWIIAIIISYFFRSILKLIQTYLLKFHIGASNILVIGLNQTAKTLISTFDKNYKYGFLVAKIIDIEGIKNLESIVEKNKIDEIIIADEKISENDALKVIEFCELNGLNLRMIPNVFRTRSVNLEFEIINSIPLVKMKRTPLDGWGAIIKRFVDIIFSLIFIIIFSPIYILIALLIKLTSKGSIFFIQKRLGYQKTFNFIKFRTMHKDAPKLHEEYIKKYGNMFKLKNDPRLTKIGGFLRRWSLDELPQFFNIFIGDMSLVGPRPPMPEEVKYYSTFQRKRLGIKPGLTGLWQVSGRSNVNFDEWVKLDIYYIENWSLWMDLGIMIKTLPAVLKKEGAY